MDDLILSQFLKIVKFLGKVLGDDYEIVLQDVRPGHEGILAIANSHISGRYSGSPLSDMALKVIENEDYKFSDYICNYNKSKSDERNLIRSSTFFIKNDDQELIGMLCINYDSTKANNLVSGIYNLCNMSGLIAESKMQKKSENLESETKLEDLPSSLGDTINNAIVDTIGVGVPSDRLSQSEKLKIVEKLSDKGVFLLKGAVTEVALKLHCSEASVYRYMSKKNKA